MPWKPEKRVEISLLTHRRQACQGYVPSLRLLLPPVKKYYHHWTASWRSQKRRHTPHSQNPHQQPDHWGHERLQVQDALRLCTFPHQREHRKELWDWPIWCGDPVFHAHDFLRRVRWSWFFYADAFGQQETSSARRLFDESPCYQVSTWKHRKIRKMNYSSQATR